MPRPSATVVLSLLIAAILGVPLGLISGRNPEGRTARITDVYTIIAGALPDFWLALVLVFFGYTVLHPAS